jgi:hypothetical protein
VNAVCRVEIRDIDGGISRVFWAIIGGGVCQKTMPLRREQDPTILITVLVLLLIALPFLAAAAASGPEHVFTGLLFNPQDGSSYLAKMFEGWRGDERFSLPYAADPGQGAYLYLFYLYLGRLAWFSGLPLPWVFHLARLGGALLLLWALLRFYRRLLPGGGAGLALALAGLGSGLGWLALFTGRTTADFWVAEAFPFLSSFANPHFPLGLGLLTWLLTPPAGDGGAPSGGLAGWLDLLLHLAAVPAALGLALVSPFGVVIALAAWTVVLAWQGWECRRDLSLACLREPGLRIAAIALGGLPYLAYTLWVVQADPQLSGWNAQNLTLSPPAWDVLLALSPALLLAIPGAWLGRTGGRAAWRVTVAWAATGVLLAYFPWGLQRRFLMGVYVPLAGLAVLALQEWKGRLGKFYRPCAAALLAASVLTNLLILVSLLAGGLRRDPALFLSRDENAALEWIAANSPLHALVLASPEMGLWIPVRTGRRVIYGHPFETPDADRQRQAVEHFFRQGGDLTFLGRNEVDFLFYGPREQNLGSLQLPGGITPVFSSGNVVVYAVDGSGARP